MRRTFDVLVPVLLAAVIGSCATPQQTTSSAEASGATPAGAESVPLPARHAMHSERLLEIMRKLDRRRRVSWPQEVEDEYRRADKASQAREFERSKALAGALASAAEAIPDAIRDIEMSDEDRLGFHAQVDRLHKGAIELQETADRGDAAAMRNVMARIDATCNECHQKYRDVAGPLSRG